MAEGVRAGIPFAGDLGELQHWTGVFGRAQQMMLDHVARQGGALPDWAANMPGWPTVEWTRVAEAQTEFWRGSLKGWQAALESFGATVSEDRRFEAPEWRAEPFFDVVRQVYQLVSAHMVRSVEVIEGLDDKQRDQLRFATRAFVDAMAPSNFPFTNPVALQRMAETRGESLLKGLRNLLDDLSRGQLTHSNPDAFRLGENIAATPGKVIYETPLFQLIHYAPTTETVREIPLLIFPPWINRFYILDLNPKKSFVRWAVAQGLSVFMVSWKSADESLSHILLDDYVAAQIEAIGVVRDLLEVEAVHVAGYCVAGTTLAATLALLAARGEAAHVASATFLTAQVDFSAAGDLSLFVDDAQLDLIAKLTAAKGYLDGRYMAATFNLLRGQDLIWNYVVSNYLLGDDYPAFDLLHWNGDITNLPAQWHQGYLRDFYRDNLLVQPGGLNVAGVAIDLGRVETPSYVQAGREDHIAPPQSVWQITRHFRGPLRFVLAGSGHIAGVINPPESGKYQYWTADDADVATFDEFVSRARETKGSWWPDWWGWLADRSGEDVSVTGSRVPGQGKYRALEDAPGRYVKLR